MVAWPGYDHIVKLSELPEGQAFASTKTGRHFIKQGGTGVRVSYDDHRGTEPLDENFTPDTLVYISPWVKAEGLPIF